MRNDKLEEKVDDIETEAMEKNMGDLDEEIFNESDEKEWKLQDDKLMEKKVDLWEREHEGHRPCGYFHCGKNR